MRKKPALFIAKDSQDRWWSIRVSALGIEAWREGSYQGPGHFAKGERVHVSWRDLLDFLSKG